MKMRPLYFVSVLLFASYNVVASDVTSDLYVKDSLEPEIVDAGKDYHSFDRNNDAGKSLRGLNIVDPSINYENKYEKKIVDPKNYFVNPKEYKEKPKVDNSSFDQKKSCFALARNPTSFMIAGPVIYYPVATVPYAIVYVVKCAWLKMRISGDIQITKGKTQQVSDKDGKVTRLIEKILKIDEKVDVFFEKLTQKIAKGIRYIKRGKTASPVPKKYVVSDKKYDFKSDMPSVRCQQWTRAILAGLFTCGLLKITDKVLRSDKFGIVGKKYVRYQNRYDANRVLVANKCVSKIVRLLNKCIPRNAYIIYQYPV